MSGFEKKVSLTGDRGFESFSLQRRVRCEPGQAGHLASIVGYCFEIRSERRLCVKARDAALHRAGA